MIWAEARVDARVEVEGRQQAVGAAHAGRSRAIRSSHGRAWLLSRRVRSRGWVPTQNEPPACRKPRSAEGCWCGGGVGRPFAWLSRSNRLAEAWSCMHRGRGGQPGWRCTAQLVRRHRTACGTGCAVVGSRMGCRFNRPIAWVELESARGGVVVHASGPRGAAERGAARRTIVRRHRTACGIVPRSGWVADGVADSMSACYF